MLYSPNSPLLGVGLMIGIGGDIDRSWHISNVFCVINFSPFILYGSPVDIGSSSSSGDEDGTMSAPAEPGRLSPEWREGGGVGSREEADEERWSPW